MLVLSRNVGEVIRIGDEISVTVLRIKGKPGNRKVTLGITAPKEVKVTLAQSVSEVVSSERRKANQQ